MASRNPFGQLQIRRDEDEEEVRQTGTTTVQSSSSGVLFSQNQQEAKKKKKVRPEEKRKLEDNNNTTTTHYEEAEDGFEVVKKGKAPQRQRQTQDENQPEERKKEFHQKNKGAHLERNDKVKPGKRQFERHSGTGRGREVAKGGAGGKHTWGNNPRNVARNAEGDFSRDDVDIFNYVNRPRRENRQRGEREQQPQEEETTTVPVEETRQEETTPQVEQPSTTTEVVANGGEESQDTTDRRNRKKKGIVTTEVNKEDLLERPQNALSYAEYMEQLRQKNQALNSQNQNRQVVVNSDLTPQTKSEDLTIGLSVSEASKKKAVRPKEKKTNARDLDVAFRTEEETTRRFENNRDNNRQRGGNKGPKFNFNKDEFPEL